MDEQETSSIDIDQIKTEARSRFERAKAWVRNNQQAAVAYAAAFAVAGVIFEGSRSRRNDKKNRKTTTESVSKLTSWADEAMANGNSVVISREGDVFAIPSRRLLSVPPKS